MKEEIDKFLHFLKEAEKTSANPPRQRLNRDFYEIWETVQKPKPFFYTKTSITFLDKNFTLIKESNRRIASFSWDDEECCPVLIVEGSEWKDKLLFIIDSGEIEIQQKQPEYLEEMGLSIGEKLEIIFDIIYHLRSEHKEIDIFSIKKNTYIPALDSIAKHYDKRTIRIMKKLSISSVKRMIDKAAEDIPRDELSQQMHLPLDGVYISKNNNENITITGPDPLKHKERKYLITKQGRWTIERNLYLLAASMQFAGSIEDNELIKLQEVEILDSDERQIVIKTPIPDNSILTEGIILSIFSTLENKKAGTVITDIVENNFFIGRVRLFKDFNQNDFMSGNFYIKKQSSVFHFLATGMEKILNDFQNNKLSPLIKNLLGVIDVEYSGTPLPQNDSSLEKNQLRAKNAALNENISTVLIQGPPGTGKTTVLVETAKELCKQGKRILITAPSHTAVDNICRKLNDIPILRFGKNSSTIATDIADKYWIGKEINVIKFLDQRKKASGGGGIYAGTHLGLLKDMIIQDEVIKNGLFDVIIFDEAGMASVAEFLLLASICKKTILFGDHKQLPPFPLSNSVKTLLDKNIGPRLKESEALLSVSALEYLANFRKFPIILLKKSFRCQNPRLLRFSSIMFYDALVSASQQAEYFSLSYFERQKKYPPDSLKFISTSSLPDKIKNETFAVKGGKPGISNQCETLIAVNCIYSLLKKYPPNEITVITPYKAQVKLIRSNLSRQSANIISKRNISQKEWNFFLFSRIATVDSFQGGESDVVIISYVRSNKNNLIGFTDNHNRINVAHTRCRKEMEIIGDINCLKNGANNPVFERLERSIQRDGRIIHVNIGKLKQLQQNILSPENFDEIAIQEAYFDKFDQENGIEKIPEEKNASIKTNSEKIVTNIGIKVEYKNSTKSNSCNKAKEGNMISFDEMPGMTQPDLF